MQIFRGPCIIPQFCDFVVVGTEGVNEDPYAGNTLREWQLQPYHSAVQDESSADEVQTIQHPCAQGDFPAQVAVALPLEATRHSLSASEMRLESWNLEKARLWKKLKRAHSTIRTRLL